MDKKQSIAIVIAVVVVIAVALYFILIPHAPTMPPSGAGVTPTNPDGTTQVTPTRTTPPANIVVPSKGEASASSDVAVPQIQSPASPTGNSLYRSFNISANNNAFTPSTIIVNQGDEVNIELTAVDKNYDFTQPDFGFKQPVVKGQTQQIQFGATASGKFTFYCASCGGPAAGPIGYIVISPKK